MSSIFKLSAFITDRRSYPHMISYWPELLKSRHGPLEKLWSGGGGREKNFRAAGIFCRCRIPRIIFFRPLGLIGVHEVFFFFHSIFPCADIVLYSRRSGQPSSKQGLDRRLFFSVLPLLRIMKRVTGVTQQQPPPKKLFKSMPWLTPKNTESTLKASLLYLFVRKRKK